MGSWCSFAAFGIRMRGSGLRALCFQQLLPSFGFLFLHFSHAHSPERQYGAGLRAQTLETSVCDLNPSSAIQELCSFAQVTQPLCASLMSCMKWDKWWYQPPKLLWGLNGWIHIKFFEQPLSKRCSLLFHPRAYREEFELWYSVSAISFCSKIPKISRKVLKRLGLMSTFGKNINSNCTREIPSCGSLILIYFNS